jgi:hypothetical protein
MDFGYKPQGDTHIVRMREGKIQTQDASPAIAELRTFQFGTPFEFLRYHGIGGPSRIRQ